ncbi:MAG: hypothetical protein H7A00_02380 [Hahellaceae bacterium]|nr:hypothetical protein [Hahellaceae bacterium]
MWYFLQGLVPALALAGAELPETMAYSRSFLFAPPACEYRVLFPQFPQRIGTLVENPTIWSAQLQLPDAFMRADCRPVNESIPLTESNTTEANARRLNSFLYEQILKFGGPNLVVLNLEIGKNHAKMTAQLFMESESVLLKTNAYIGEYSMLTLTAIEHDRVRSGTAAERFMHHIGRP